MVHRAPVPAFPTIGIVVHARHADRVGETVKRRKVITDIAPGVMRAVRHRDRTGPEVAPAALDLVCDHVECLIPRDAHILRLAAILRIAPAVRIEVDAFHRMQQPRRRIDDRLGILAVWRQRRFARRRKFQAARTNRPGLRIGVVEIDRRHAYDLAVLYINKDRPAIGHVAIPHRAIRHRRSKLPASGLAHHEV